MKNISIDVQKALADACETPGEFIRCVMTLKKLSPKSLSEKMGVTNTYVRMIRNDHCPLANQGYYNFAKALEINPYLLASVGSRYKMKQFIEEHELRSDN